jgi:hypothetical protein
LWIKVGEELQNILFDPTVVLGVVLSRTQIMSSASRADKMGNLYVNSEGKQTFYSRDNADISCRLE